MSDEYDELREENERLLAETYKLSTQRDLLLALVDHAMSRELERRQVLWAEALEATREELAEFGPPDPEVMAEVERIFRAHEAKWSDPPLLPREQLKVMATRPELWAEIKAALATPEEEYIRRPLPPRRRVQQEASYEQYEAYAEEMKKQEAEAEVEKPKRERRYMSDD